MNTIKAIDGQLFKKLIEASLNWLRTNQQIVNSLNVFPVPDGDTGTNMLLTMQAAYNEIQNSEDNRISTIAHDIAQGALMGARGNSGVILSQIWRGFSRGLEKVDEMTVKDFAIALDVAKSTAYKGVVRPVEGTILTVAKDVSAAAKNISTTTDDIEEFLSLILETADLSVKNTPNLLPILKQAGVVDSGGKGYYFILEGFLKYLRGESLESTTAKLIQPIAMVNGGEMDEIEPGQDFEVIVDFKPKEPLNLDIFYSDLSKMGTSIQLGEGDGMYRMHIHVPIENRYLPIDYTMGLGTITKVFIENLIEQIQQTDKESQDKLTLNPVENGQIALVVVSPGQGLTQIFASLGASAIVAGGQTMNPSIEEILAAFENLPTDKVIILPNNKNIIMAATSAKESSVKQVQIIPSKSIPQGLSAMLRFDPTGDIDEIVSEMKEALHEVDTGEITVATRSVDINGVNVNEGEAIALYNSDLISSSSSIVEACYAILDKVDKNEKERVTFFYGVNISKQDVNQITDQIRKKYPYFEIEVHEGGQPHYQFIISIE